MGSRFDVVLYLNHDLEKMVQKYRETLATDGISNKLIEEIEYRPSITLFSQSGPLEFYPFNLFAIKDDFNSSKTSRFPVTFSSIGSFSKDQEGYEDDSLFLGVTPSVPLLSFQSKIIDAVKVYQHFIPEKYTPDSWIPHIPIATAIPDHDHMEKGFCSALDKINLPITGFAEEIDVVERKSKKFTSLKSLNDV